MSDNLPAIDLTILIPAYNEGLNIDNLEQQIFPIIQQLQQENSVELLIVDDGSTDDTAAQLLALAERHPEVVVLQHAQNRGSGAAFSTGFAAARGAWIITTDADGTYRFDEIPNLLALCGPHVDIVTASPYHPRGAVANVPYYRIALSRGASTLYRMLVGGHIYTYTSFFRAYRKAVLQVVPVRSNDFLAVAQILAEASMRGFRIVEYPTTLYVRRFGQSKAKIVRLTLAHLRFMAELLRLQLSRSGSKTRFGEHS